VRFTEKGVEMDRVGRIADVGPNAFTIDALSQGAEWIGVEEYAYEDILSIHAGGSYERALALVVGASALDDRARF
jgi:hypothetical protein